MQRERRDKKTQIKRRIRRRKSCTFCAEAETVVDYKATERYKRLITDRGKVVPRRNSGVCAKHQRKLTEAIKRARTIGLVPYCVD
ncbi:MAG: small subunit ribosomal protein S18 [Candidatus Marinamargulisbacteria bacterium]|jgi:small subunit ribosomal protein S18